MIQNIHAKNPDDAIDRAAKSIGTVQYTIHEQGGVTPIGPVL